MKPNYIEIFKEFLKKQKIEKRKIKSIGMVNTDEGMTIYHAGLIGTEKINQKDIELLIKFSQQNKLRFEIITGIKQKSKNTFGAGMAINFFEL